MELKVTEDDIPLTEKPLREKLVSVIECGDIEMLLHIWKLLQRRWSAPTNSTNPSTATQSDFLGFIFSAAAQVRQVTIMQSLLSLPEPEYTILRKGICQTKSMFPTFRPSINGIADCCTRSRYLSHAAIHSAIADALESLVYMLDENLLLLDEIEEVLLVLLEKAEKAFDSTPFKGEHRQLILVILKRYPEFLEYLKLESNQDDMQSMVLQPKIQKSKRKSALYSSLLYDYYCT